MNQARADMKNNFNPKTGVTNVDFAKFDKARESLKNAAQNSSGENAQIAGIISAYLERIESAEKTIMLPP